MPFRRFRSFGPRRAVVRPRYTWVRDIIHDVGPANPNSQDLLANWRTASGMALNVLDYTIWRIHIKISIDIHLTAAAYTSDTGYAFGIYVDSKNQTQLAAGPLADQYDQRFLMWDTLFLNKTIANTPFPATVNTATYALYQEYDIRSRRKVGESDTLWVQLSSRGNAQADQFDLLYSVLLRHR